MTSIYYYNAVTYNNADTLYNIFYTNKTGVIIRTGIYEYEYVSGPKCARTI